jgi:ATP-dependent Clp protease ATP-binding subunit ClpC
LLLPARRALASARDAGCYGETERPSTGCNVACIIARVSFGTTTDTLSKIFANAQQEARRLNQDFVGTEHLAMALLDQDDSEAGRLLRQLHVETGYVRNVLGHTLPAGKEPPVVHGNLPMSPKAQRLVTGAVVAAQQARSEKVTTRHLLSALLAEAQGVVCESYRRSGADAAELVKAMKNKDVVAEP